MDVAPVSAWQSFWAHAGQYGPRIDAKAEAIVAEGGWCEPKDFKHPTKAEILYALRKGKTVQLEQKWD